MKKTFETPVLFIIFNRPHLVQRVFDVIKSIEPKNLYIACDGPRLHIENEAEKLMQSKKITEQIDWDCEVKTFFNDTNLGPGKGVSTAINWFFEQVDEGIIIEEDCLPHFDFFGYCSELLEKYRDNEKIMLISGNKFINTPALEDQSYYFSAYPLAWGWATWKNVWQHYDFTLKRYNTASFKKTLKKYFRLWTERQVWLDKFLLMKKFALNTWDYQLYFAIWENNGIAILPCVNLVSNIGYAKDAVHCKDPTDKFANIPYHNILPLKHPKKIKTDILADEKFYRDFLYKPPLIIVYRTIRRFFIKNRFKK